MPSFILLQEAEAAAAAILQHRLYVTFQARASARSGGDGSEVAAAAAAVDPAGEARAEPERHGPDAARRRKQILHGFFQCIPEDAAGWCC